jgi:hypothetical protein
MKSSRKRITKFSRTTYQENREEIRFFKEQQWKPVYFTLLFFSTVVIIFSDNFIDTANQYFCVLKWMAYILVTLVFSVSIYWQWSHFETLQKLRKEDIRIGRTKKKTITSIIITVMFNIITISGAAFVLFYISSLSPA